MANCTNCGIFIEETEALVKSLPKTKNTLKVKLFYATLVKSIVEDENTVRATSKLVDEISSLGKEEADAKVKEGSIIHCLEIYPHGTSV